MQRAPFFFSVLLLWLAPRALSAQTIRGQVVEAVSGTPVDAGFVLLLRADGKELLRILADRQGRFTVRAPAAGRYTLRSERIGFKVTTSPPIDLAEGQTLDYTLQVAAVPVRLEVITVAADAKCRVRPEEGRATATVWDEARKALTAVAWVQTQQRLRVKIRNYERELQTDYVIKRETSQTLSGTAKQPFQAKSPQDLAAHGYVQRDAGDTLTFTLPDATVLFSDEFLNRHCFKLQPSRDSTTVGLVGLAFEPAAGGGKVSDIKGVMWLDERTAELRWVDVRYTNVNLAVSADLTGGRVEFQRLTNGGWIVSRYFIRMPIISMVQKQNLNRVSDLVHGGTQIENRPELTGIREEGGEVLEAYSTEGTRLAQSLGATLAGTVFDPAHSAPLAGARVGLAGAAYSGLTGAGGEFQLDGLPEGVYSVVFSHPDFPGWGVLPGISQVPLRRGQVTRIQLAVPSPKALFGMLCADADGKTMGAVGGRVSDTLRLRPVRDAAVQIRWATFDVSPAGRLSERRAGVEVRTDSVGTFLACGVPADRTLEASVAESHGESKPVSFEVEAGEVAEVRLVGEWETRSEK